MSLMTKNPTVASDTHIACVGHVTADELRRHLQETDAANGFANRFLWLCVRRSQFLPDGGKLDVEHSRTRFATGPPMAHGKAGELTSRR